MEGIDRWRKSSYSGNGGECVEVADPGNRVLVRDTKDRAGTMLRFSPAAWRRFAEQVKRSLQSGHQAGLPTLAGGTLVSARCPPSLVGGGTAGGTPCGVRAGRRVAVPGGTPAGAGGRGAAARGVPWRLAFSTVIHAAGAIVLVCFPRPSDRRIPWALHFPRSFARTALSCLCTFPGH
jgi:hypothetical protein